MFRSMIKLQLETLLKEREKTLYWLASPEGADVEYATLWRLKEGRSKGISFELMDKLCSALECSPGDLFIHAPGGPHIHRRAAKKARKPRPPKDKVLFED
jgi:putative transcriptional regulator